jgi:hypothetical protein
MITELRRSIIGRLEQYFIDRVRVISDDTERGSGAKALVKTDYIARVGYSGSSFDSPDNHDDVALQKVTRSFQISLEILDLRTEDRTIQLLEDIENKLMGFCPSINGVIGQFSLLSDRFQQNKDGVYFYIINLSIPCCIFKDYRK